MEKVNLTWNDVTIRASGTATEIKKYLTGNKHETLKLYGVPRGGIFAALAVLSFLDDKERFVLTSNPSEAEYFIDDIIDTGKTKEKYKKEFSSGINFFALVDKSKHWKTSAFEDLRGKWISFPWERMTNEDAPTENIRRLLEYIGEDPNRPGLKDTPERVIKSYEKLFGGYKQEISHIIKVFNDKCKEMIILKNIEFYSTCEHHMLPFFGKAHIAYIPNGKVIGISKLAKILEVYSRRAQIQERIAQQVVGALDAHLQPAGAACIIEAQHMCMLCRGIEKQNSSMITSSLSGVFMKEPQARAELMSIIIK